MTGTICEYCKTVNQPGAGTCVACGAPIPKLSSIPLTTVSVVPSDRFQNEISISTTNQNQDLVKTGQIIDRTYRQVLDLIGQGYRTISEIAAILITSFLLGLFGGFLNEGFASIFSAIVVGVTIGYVDKSYWSTLLGAPLAILCGIALGGVAWLLGVPGILIVFAITVLGIGGALLGRRPRYRGRLGCRELVEAGIGGGLAGTIALITWVIFAGLMRLIQH
jgi:hypothetical protein